MKIEVSFHKFESAPANFAALGALNMGLYAAVAACFKIASPRTAAIYSVAKDCLSTATLLPFCCYYSAKRTEECKELIDVDETPSFRKQDMLQLSKALGVIEGVTMGAIPAILAGTLGGRAITLATKNPLTMRSMMALEAVTTAARFIFKQITKRESSS